MSVEIDIGIRYATQWDMPRVIEMGRRFLIEGPYREQLKDNPQEATNCAFRVLKSMNGNILVADAELDIVGVFAFILFPHYFSGELTAGELFWYVEPEWRKGGTGIKLLAEAEKVARDHGAKRMQLTAPVGSLGLLFRRCGYTEVETMFQRTL